MPSSRRTALQLTPKDSAISYSSRNENALSATAAIGYTSNYGLTGMESVQEEEEAQEDVKIGVLLLNLGGPEKSEDVEGEIQFRVISLTQWRRFYLFYLGLFQ